MTKVQCRHLLCKVVYMRTQIAHLSVHILLQRASCSHTCREPATESRISSYAVQVHRPWYQLACLKPYLIVPCRSANVERWKFSLLGPDGNESIWNTAGGWVSCPCEMVLTYYVEDSADAATFSIWESNSRVVSRELDFHADVLGAQLCTALYSQAQERLSTTLLRDLHMHDLKYFVAI